MEMSFNGEFEVAIPREETYDLLVNPSKFIPVLPTYHAMSEKAGEPGTYIVKVKVGIGKIHGIATTEMSLNKNDHPKTAGYIGKGKVMGGAYNMITSFELEDTPSGGTLIKWEGTSQIYGKILSLAGGGMRGYAEKEITKVIDSLQAALSSTEAFEKTVAMATTKTDEGVMTRVINFFKRLFGAETVPDRQDKEEITTPPLKPVHKDTAIPVTPIQDRVAAEADSNRNWVGQPLSRKEDSRLLRGLGHYVDDNHSSDMLHIGFVCSPYASATIVNIDTSAVDAMEGVFLVMTGKECAAEMNPFHQMAPEPIGSNINDYGIAVDKVRYPGEPVVLIVAESAPLVEDAIEVIEVEYDVQKAVVNSVETQQPDAPILHEDAGTNTIFHDVWNHGDVDKAFAEADVVVKLGEMKYHRFTSTPIENAGAVVSWSKQGDLEIINNSGLPPINSQMLSMSLGVSTSKIHMKSHDIGGSFGIKTITYPFITLSCLASKRLGGRQIKWIETRSENLQTFQGSERTFLDTEVALTKEGDITGLRSRHIDDCGAFPRYEPLGGVIWSQVYPHCYRIRNLNIDFSQVLSNRAPATPNRGYSRLHYSWFFERVIDICAHELGIPADKIRERNFIKPEQFPYETPNGCVYDSGDYPGMLEKCKELIDYDGWMKRRDAMRKEGRLIGIGIGTIIDSGTNNFGQSVIMNKDSIFSGNTETCRIKIDLDGSVVVMLGSVPQGQGHETVTSQVIADVLNIKPDMINVRTGFNSAWNTYAGMSGTIASQFVVTGLSAAKGAADKLKGEILKIGAFMLECSEEDIEFGVGEMGPQVCVKGSPDRAVNYWALANMALQNGARLPENLRDIDFNVRYTYRPPFEIPDRERKFGNLTLTYSALLNIAVVEVDPDTYQTKILDYAYVDDCGTQINPKIVAGQVAGGVAHGIAAAMQEAIQIDDSGNLITGTFTDYAPYTSMNMPDTKSAVMESPSPFTLNGAKGVGESAGSGLCTLSAAIQDALFEKDIILTYSHNAPSILMDIADAPNRQTAVQAELRA